MSLDLKRRTNNDYVYFLIYLAGVVKPLFTILVSVVTFGIVGVTLIVLYCAEEERPSPFWVWKALV